MNLSLGILEVVGLTAAVSCTDVMVKSAFVEIYKVERIGSGLVTVIIQGDLASVQVAIEKGIEEAGKYNSLHGYEVIPRPYDGIDNIFTPGEKGDEE